MLNGVSFNPWKTVTLSLLRPIICEQALNRFNSLLSTYSLLSFSFLKVENFGFTVHILNIVFCLGNTFKLNLEFLSRQNV